MQSMSFWLCFLDLLHFLLLIYYHWCWLVSFLSSFLLFLFSCWFSSFKIRDINVKYMVVVVSGCSHHVHCWQVMVSLYVKLKAVPGQVSLFDELAARMCWPVRAPQRCPHTTLTSGVTLTGTCVQRQSLEHHLHVPLRIQVLSSNCNMQETCQWTAANGISENPAGKSWERVGNRIIEYRLRKRCTCQCQTVWDTVKKVWGRGLNIILWCQRVTVGLHHYCSNLMYKFRHSAFSNIKVYWSAASFTSCETIPFSHSPTVGRNQLKK